MRMRLALVPVLFLGVLSLATACKKGGDGPDLSSLGPASAATTTILSVGSQNCPDGGIGIYSGHDQNANGTLEASEYENGTPVCLPPAGDEQPGEKTALVRVVSEPSGTVHCPAGGLKVLSGPDRDGNDVLAADEVTHTEYLCNGAPDAGSMAGISVAVGSIGAAPEKGKRKKGRQKSAARKRKAGKAGVRAAPKKVRTAPKKEKRVAAKPAAPPKGWTSVAVDSPQFGAVSYKVERKNIVVRFTNPSTTSTVRFKYTVAWKTNRNGNWVEDSSAQGLTIRLRPEETLDRNVRTMADEVRDVVVQVDVKESD